jgi:group I intron endonuclease
MEPVMLVYLIRNRANGKCYVGKTTTTLQARWYRHLAEVRMMRHDFPLYRDMRFFGQGFFEIEEIGRAHCQRRLNQMERKFIRLFNAVENGYNRTMHSYGGKKYRCSQPSAPKSAEHKARIAAGVRASWAQKKAAAA